MVDMGYWNDATIDDYQRNTLIGYPEESHTQAHILDAKYLKLELNELARNQYCLLSYQRKNMKEIVQN